MASKFNGKTSNDLFDPLAGDVFEPEEAVASSPVPTKPGKQPKKPKKSRKSKSKDEIVRPDDLRRQIAKEAGDDIDVDKVLSAYIPMRRTRIMAKSLLRTDKMKIWLLILFLIILIIFILSFMQEKMGNFTINLDRLELYRKGLAISQEGDFLEPTARLTANPVIDATNITYTDIPSNVADIDGDHNGNNYVAYTYYLRNAGKEDVALDAVIKIDKCSKGAEEAVRVAVWKNGEKTVYAHKARNGRAEPGCVNFESDDVVCTFHEDNFEVGMVNKYTVVIWMEGEDPECVDRIIGGSVEFSMNIQATNQDDTSLIRKYIQDIVDTITGNKPINPAGVENPDFQKYENVTWNTRKNK